MTAPAPIPAPIILSALFAPAEQARLDAERHAHFPPERNHLPAHLTLFHHLPPSCADELKHRLSQATRGVAPPAAELARPYALGRGVAYRVRSEALEAIRDDLADAFAGLLTPQDAAPWRPHVTIQNKVDPAAARRLLATLERDWRPRATTITALAAWWYRGGPWEPLARYAFGGRW